MRERVGFIGLGTMGQHMVRNIRRILSAPVDNDGPLGLGSALKVNDFDQNRIIEQARALRPYKGGAL